MVYRRNIGCHRTCTRALERDAVLVNRSIERDTRDTHLLGRLFDIAAIAFEGGSDESRFDASTGASEILGNRHVILVRYGGEPRRSPWIAPL